MREVAGNNGRVGVYGNSYPGFYALMAAASGHPALKAASPQAPVTDWFMGDDTHHNGVLFLRDAFSFIGGSFGRPMDNPTTEAAAAPRYVRTDEYDFFLRKATVDSLTQLLGDTVRFWNEMMRHPDYDDWWRERCSVRAMHDLRPAILVVGGLFDAEDCYGAWTTYASIRRQSPRTSCRMVAGPWVHGGWRSSNGGNRLGKMRFGDASLTDYYQQRIEVPFFNYYLLGKGDGGAPSKSGLRPMRARRFSFFAATARCLPRGRSSASRSAAIAPIPRRPCPTISRCVRRVTRPIW